ncbi:amino acid permease [Pullulanibacillus pueri]|uniref:Uncharacterized protein n=1 Tax=Pullulanibacillus pueri TaxID=1437324 RepID=A0A8J2ZZB5_9BACL|nr:hypothetical protein [Pullulanibacillus pueri]MBM7683764.1 amino acid permease [Pullulanibacillus pueri]GGH87311.1 hypothetical protein GCM10007096_37040 [Pullulanibacillus pueri]
MVIHVKDSLTINVGFILMVVILAMMFNRLIKWSKELKERRFTLYLYFLISCTNVPLYQKDDVHDVFRLWFPLGFVFVLLYLLWTGKQPKVKFKASLMGFAVALLLLVMEYNGFDYILGK